MTPVKRCGLPLRSNEVVTWFSTHRYSPSAVGRDIQECILVTGFYVMYDFQPRPAADLPDAADRTYRQLAVNKIVGLIAPALYVAGDIFHFPAGIGLPAEQYCRAGIDHFRRIL